MRIGDPTEYTFVTRYIGTWDIWESMYSSSNNYRVIIDAWRRELEVKIKSDAINRIIDAAKGETRDALQANKYLLDTPWLKEESKRGRPTKQDVLSEANKIAVDEQRIAEDFKRVVSDA